MIGIVFLFVDELLRAGTSNFYQVMYKFRTICHIGSENHDVFTYLAVNFKQNRWFRYNRSIHIY